MALKLRDIILEDVRALIRSLTGFQEDQDNFQACEQFILSNLLHGNYMSVDRNAVRRSMEGMILKLQVHNFTKEGQELDTLVKEFLASTDFKDYSTVDIQWCLLSLILHLSHNPTDPSRSEKNFESHSAIVNDNVNEFDWVSYLREGEEEFYQDYGHISSDEDEVDCMVAIPDESELQQAPIDAKQFVTSVPTQHKSIISLHSSSSNDLSSIVEKGNSKPRRMVNVKKIMGAECWLKAYSQYGWWEKAHVSDTPLSKHPFSQTAHLCKSQCPDGIQTSTLSEHKVVMEVLWFLSAPCDTVVFMKVVSEDGLKTHFRVRHHVTVPSLMEEVFYSFATYFCAYADMIEDLQTFCKDVYAMSDSNQVCRTYEAYAAALQYELEPMFVALSQLQQQAARQDVTFTLQVLAKELYPWLSKLGSLHNLHQCAVLDWKQNPNWLCATHLLSVVLSSLQSKETDNGVEFRIFVRAFQAYILIIEQWLSGGHLVDPRDEFFIARGKIEGSTLGASFEKRDWEEALISFGIECPNALQALANSLLKTAQPLHVLCKLDRLLELRKHTSGRRSLECLFLQHLINDLEASQTHENETSKKNQENPDQWWKKLDQCLDADASKKIEVKETAKPFQMNSSVDVKAVTNYLHQLNLPLNTKHSEGLSCDMSTVETVGTHCMEADTLLSKLMALSHSTRLQMPAESLQRAVLCLSADWEGVAGGLVADILVGERRLHFHLHTAQSVFLLQTPHLIQPFLSHVFKLILHRGDMMWTNSHTLSILLQDCMDSDQFSLEVLLGDKDPMNMNALDCIDSYHIRYQMEWPLCAIMGEKSQDDLNYILRLLLKVKWGLWILNQLDMSDFSQCDSTGISEQFFLLRHCLLHVVRGSYQFLVGDILHSLCEKFEADLKSAKDMHSIIQVHGRFLDNALHKCLRAKDPDPIKNALFQLVILAENLHSLWKQDLSKISSNKLRNIEGCYIECHRFLAASLHTLAEAEGVHHLEALSDLFSWSTPHEAVL